MKGLVFPLVALVALQILAMVWGIESDNLASPVSVLQAAWTAALDGTVLTAASHTLSTTLGGLAIGGTLGLLLGLLIGLVQPIDRLLTVSLEFLRPVPSVALIPIALLIFGLGYRMELVIVAKGCFWPILIMTRAAIRGIHPRLMEVSRMLKLGPVARIWKIFLPAALPRLFVGLRLAAGVGLTIAVTVEIATNPYGLGYAVMFAQQSFRPDLMFGMLLWIGIIGWSFNAFLLFAQNRLFGRAALVGARS
ncbi:ABC-type transporter, integral membrane subunit [Rhizobium sp. CF080]|uniref:ABC transporter permease n=1 Tax=Rhizobium sp. (strain CF080) TaxID=1144310 RepID=UPI000271D73F|nr:ABC transporter permease subunit [Rhizobium sp. CF080]EUB99175.1 ABC-type transporter, integral membrane subunit [Rhizobium sp. CF080]